MSHWVSHDSKLDCASSFLGDLHNGKGAVKKPPPGWARGPTPGSVDSRLRLQKIYLHQVARTGMVRVAEVDRLASDNRDAGVPAWVSADQVGEVRALVSTGGARTRGADPRR